MAGEWIKMRVMLGSDPKVISMADFLAGTREFMNWLTDPVRNSCKETAYEHVTRSVTCSVTVAGLLLVWGVASERGKRDSERDMRIDCASLDTLDEISGVPGFGEAMRYVGWAKVHESSVIFPNFCEDNSIVEDRKKEQARERQRRKRERDMSQRDKSVTVTLSSSLLSSSLSSDGSSVLEGSLRETAPIDPSPGTSLCTPRFLEAWVSYRNHRRQLGDRPLTQAAETAALARLTGWGIDRAVAALEHTVAMGWKNIREPEAVANNGPAKMDVQAIVAAAVKSNERKYGARA